jgi:hypothetical protein
MDDDLLRADYWEDAAEHGATGFTRKDISRAIPFAANIGRHARRAAELIEAAGLNGGTHLEVLRALGWALYEVSFRLTTLISPQFSSADELALLGELRALAECAERLPFRHYAVRAVGAIRAYALALSKSDTPDAYAAAWAEHRAADKWLLGVQNSVSPDSSEARACRELQIQLETAKAGTACRAVETYLCQPHRLSGNYAGEYVLKEVARNARDAIVAGTSALLAFRSLGDHFEGGRRETLARREWARQPANMAARAHLLIIPCMAILQAAGVPYTEWSEAERRTQSELLNLSEWPETYDEDVSQRVLVVRQLINLAEAAVLAGLRPTGALIRPADVAETARVRLHLALQCPAAEQPSAAPEIPYADALLSDPAHGLASWLEQLGQDASVVGSALYIPWILGFERVRRHYGGAGYGSYIDWRASHPGLDRFLRTLAVGDAFDERSLAIAEALADARDANGR